MCAWPRRAASSWGFLEGILQELDQGHRDAALASHVSQEKMWSRPCHMCTCVLHLQVVARSHQYRKGLSQVWLNRPFRSTLDVEKDMRCFNFLPKLAFGVRTGILFSSFINRHFHRLCLSNVLVPELGYLHISYKWTRYQIDSFPGECLLLL